MPVGNNDIVRITAKFSYAGNDVQNVYHCKVDATADIPNSTFLSEMAADIDSMYDEIVTEIHNSIHFDTIEMYNISGDEYIGEIDWPSKTTGSGAVDRLPVQCAALVKFPTSTLRSQGRKFLPPYHEDAKDSAGNPTSVALANLADWAADVLTTKTGTNWSAVMGNWSPTLLRFAEWTSAVIATFFATQRRRYSGSGS
jgi:hypothetical protein